MGVRVTGVDIATDYIAELRATANLKKLPITAIADDFLTVPLPELGAAASFDAAYCLGNSFSFFPRPYMLAFLTRIATLLKPGARLLVHSEMVAESVLPDYQTRNWQPIETETGDTILFMVENEYDPLESRIDSHLTYIKNGKVETRLAQHYVYTLSELSHLFAESGLPVINCFGTADCKPYTFSDEAVWILAERVFA